MVQSKFFNMGQILITRGISETVGESERFAAEVVHYEVECKDILCVSKRAGMDERDGEKGLLIGD